MAKGSMIAEDKKWQVESDLRTLCEAQCIKKDPKRMKAVQQMAKERMMEIAPLISGDED